MKSPSLQIGSFTFDWGSRTYVMGILNVTPDSFSGDGIIAKGDKVDVAVEQARGFLASGADILDVGGESTRPGAEPLDAQAECSRVIPVIEQIARQYELCPFEFSLDLALWVDCIICDYNYAFDPRVYLHRFFDFSTEPYIFLVDEAHNLPDRARAMYSAELDKSAVLALQQELEDTRLVRDTTLVSMHAGVGPEPSLSSTSHWPSPSSSASMISSSL